MSLFGGGQERRASKLSPLDDADVIGRRFLPFAVTASLAVFGLLTVAIIAGVAAATLRTGISASGVIEARAVGRLRVAEAGRVINVTVSAGDFVAAGDELVLLDTTAIHSERSALARRLALKLLDSTKLALATPLDASDSRSRIAAAEARVHGARRALLRVMTDNLVAGDPDSVAAASTSRVHINLDVASSSLLAAKADLALAMVGAERASVGAVERRRVGVEIEEIRALIRDATARRERHSLRADRSGVVVTEGLHLLLGESVSVGQLLVEVQELKRWDARLSVNETDIAEVQINDSVDLELPALAQMEQNHVRGIVTKISERVEPKVDRIAPPIGATSAFEVIVRIDPVTSSGRNLPLRSGYTVKARIVSEPRGALRIVIRSLKAATRRLGSWL